MDSVLRQLIRFGVVGLISFGIDYGLLFLLTELWGLQYLFSSGISFSISVVANYLLSMRFVFRPRKNVNKASEFILFLLLSITGLGLTEILMWAGVEILQFHYMISKIIVTGIVMIYNFVTRKIFLEERTKVRHCRKPQGPL